MCVTCASVCVHWLVCTLGFLHTWRPEDSMLFFKQKPPCFWRQGLSWAWGFFWVSEAGRLVSAKGPPVSSLPAGFFFFFRSFRVVTQSPDLQGTHFTNWAIFLAHDFHIFHSRLLEKTSDTFLMAPPFLHQLIASDQVWTFTLGPSCRCPKCLRF